MKRNGSSILVVISMLAGFILAGCSGVIDTMQDFKHNLPPQLEPLPEGPVSADELDPAIPVTITVAAHDPEGKPLSFEFDSDDGSFADQVDTAEGSTVRFYPSPYLKPEWPVKAWVTVMDDKGFTDTAEIDVGTMRSGPTIAGVGTVPRYLRGDSQVPFTFTVNQTGLYQVRVVTGTPSYDPSIPGNTCLAGGNVTVHIDGPDSSGGDVGVQAGVTNRVAVIFQDSLGNSDTMELNIDVDDTPPASAVDKGSMGSLEPIPVTITSADVLSGVYGISYRIYGPFPAEPDASALLPDPDFIGHGAVVQGNTILVSVGRTNDRGIYVLKYRSRDVLGNDEDVQI